MPFIPAFQTVKVLIRQTFQAEELLNVLWFASENPILASTLEDIAAGVGTWWLENLVPILSDQHEIVDVIAIGQDEVNSPQRLVGVNTPGAVAGDPLPGNVALAVTFKSLYRGRSYQGRAFMGGIPRTAILTDDYSNAANSGFLSAMLDAWDVLSNYVPGSIDGNPSHVVASHVSAGVPRETALTSIVTSYSVNAYFDSQRRRLHGRGA